MLATAAATVPLPQQFVLANGIRLLVYENPTNDIIAARCFLGAGSTQEPTCQSGLLNLLATVLTKGTSRLSSIEIAEIVESRGASLGTDVSTDYFLLSLKTVSEDFAELLTLSAELLREPTFPEVEVALEKQLLLQAIRNQQEQPTNVAYDLLRRSLYGSHPYAFDSLGRLETVSQLTSADLQAAHQRFFRPDQLVISIAGNLDAQQAVSRVEAAFGDWYATGSRPEDLDLPPVQLGPAFSSQARETQQIMLMLGYPTVPVTDPDYAALKLASTYLGNGMSSRLFVELREKQGLAYDTSAFFPTRLGPAPFVAYIGTAPDNAHQALAGLLGEVERLSQDRLTPEELQTSQNKLLGQYALSKQTNAQVAQIFGWYEILGLGATFDLDFQRAIAAVTVEDIRRAAQRFLQRPHITAVGPVEALQQAQQVAGSAAVGHVS
jgi:predicted Zn-dependent peptidase